MKHRPQEQNNRQEKPRDARTFQCERPRAAARRAALLPLVAATFCAILAPARGADLPTRFALPADAAQIQTPAKRSGGFDSRIGEGFDKIGGKLGEIGGEIGDGLEKFGDKVKTGVQSSPLNRILPAPKSNGKPATQVLRVAQGASKTDVALLRGEKPAKEGVAATACRVVAV
ncbi:MAG: hypothetical protein HUK22_01155, partial [Thermoguttaceae bacterium]|nr:hypothetical protein [Thermoguttaceae bacterium]